VDEARASRRVPKAPSRVLPRVAAALCAALLAGGTARAQIPPEPPSPIPFPRFEIALLAGYQLNSSLTWNEVTPYTSVGIDNSPTWGVTGGYEFGPSLEGEIQYSYTKPKATAFARNPEIPSPTFEIGIHQFQFVGVTNFAPPGASVRPYFGLGVGFTVLNGSPTLENAVQPAFSVLLGVKAYFGKTFGLRLEFRYAPAFLYTTGDGTEFCFDVNNCWNTGDRYLHQIDFRGGATFRF